MTFAGFNRRMRKTARPVVWKGYGVQLPVPPSDPWECGWRLGRCYGVLQIKYNGVVVNNQKGATRHDAKPT